MCPGSVRPAPAEVHREVDWRAIQRRADSQHFCLAPVGERADLVEVSEPGSYEYFLALQQDYEQMPRQQQGLRNLRLTQMALVREEVVIAHWHSVLDRYLAAAGRSPAANVARPKSEPVEASVS